MLNTIKRLIPGPPWFLRAQHEIGVREVSGPAHNPVILKYAEDARLPWVYTADEIAWCAIFVNAMLERDGIVGTRSAWAKDFCKWGKKCDPKPGCVAVFNRGKNGGHVGFFVQFNPDKSAILVLGGNQSNAVNLQWYDADQLIDFREPASIPIPVSETAAGEVPQSSVPEFDPVELRELRDELKRSGSRTIQNAEIAEKTVKRGLGGIIGLEAVRNALDYVTDLVPYSHQIKTVLDTLKDYQVLILAGIAAVLLYALTNIVIARVDDLKTGKRPR